MGVSVKRRMYFLGEICCTLLCLFIVGGCSARQHVEQEPNVTVNEAQSEKDKIETNLDEQSVEISTETMVEEILLEPEIIEEDWSDYFDGFTGAAVLYEAANGRYRIFNSELAQTRRSPCSTFKIISSLIALESGLFEPEHSTRPWSGEIFWNENWNRDIDFYEAFRTSCVWYFREVIDEIGPEQMQKQLDALSYGNCDISDWAGAQNTNNNNRALTGFWLESSLSISPKEQTEVMERIFGTKSVYSEKTQEQLKQAMLVMD